jgi:DNA-binding GntR family transcriptional regulator
MQELTIPKYLKLRDDLAADIVAGKYAPGQKLKSERLLSYEFGIARMTVRDALLLLEGEGLIYREKRRGYFVAPERLSTNPTQHKNAFRLLQEAGREAGAVTQPAIVVAATRSRAAMFGVKEGEPLILLTGTCLSNGRRVCYEENALLASCFEGFFDTEFYDPITDFVYDQFGFVPEQTGFRARTTSLRGRVAKELGVAVGTPGLFITRVKSNGGTIVQVDREYWLADTMEVVVGDVPD